MSTNIDDKYKPKVIIKDDVCQILCKEIRTIIKAQSKGDSSEKMKVEVYIASESTKSGTKIFKNEPDYSWECNELQTCNLEIFVEYWDDYELFWNINYI